MEVDAAIHERAVNLISTQVPTATAAPTVNHSKNLRIMAYYRVCCKSVPWDARRQTPSPFLADVLYAFPAARNGGHYSGSSPFAAAPRPRFQPYHGRRLPPATQRRPPPPSFGSRGGGRRLGRRFAMFTGGLVDADDDAFDFDDY